ncbi:MAG TPA: hypothetical protein VIF62_37270 [Labilithrix sp.]
MVVRSRPWSFFVAILAVLALVAACSSSGDDSNPFDTGGGGKDGGGDDGNPNGGGICLLNNCGSDAECVDCTNGRQKCSQNTHRCIACGPDAGGAVCPGGQYCTQFGECVPNGTTCPVDMNGFPTIANCKGNADCAACSPRNRICDTGTGKCVGCTQSDTEFCQSTDICASDESCKPKCPATCTTDGDCGLCGATGHEAHACNRHVCSQCSPTKTCDGGLTCDTSKGTCKPTCGTPGTTGDKCTMDGQCGGCAAATKCDVPVNGGTGTCSVPATGCSDLGSFAVLPAPFSGYTNLCSSDMDCRSVDITYNAGKELRDITGASFIKDANVDYPMHACASVSILGKSCGVCVPCKQDSDCTPIDVTKFAGDAFGPLGAAATSVLLDKVFGPSSKEINMYCQHVAGDYGVCVPCANFLSRCGDGGDIPPGAQCNHDECTSGDRLAPTCTTCTAAVCAKDSYCCANTWDDLCKLEVEDFCTTKTCHPDSCAYRPAGWYCFEDASKGGYRCAEGTMDIAEGRQCPSNQYCHKTGMGAKDPAVLCTSDAQTGCGTGETGKPECFTTP